MEKTFDSIQEKIHYLEEHACENETLGVTYSEKSSLFKVWSPLAKQVTLNLYETGNEKNNSLIEQIEMTQENNVWKVSVDRNSNGLFYTYKILHFDGKETETPDIYSKAVGLNGNRSAIVHLENTNPINWNNDKPVRQTSITDAIIWETHIEDFSSHENGGFSQEYRGKYLAFTEENTYLYGDATSEISTGTS